jgi:poly-gamma-glutamate synthesis protein (capsule biosynthesis protein)
MKLLFCGDIMPGGVLPYQTSYIDTDVSDYMSQFDARIGTLEAAIGTSLPYDTVKMEGKQNVIYARDEDFFRVTELGINLVSLANNHVYDLGAEGLANTIQMLDKHNILHCGAGMTDEEAGRPAVLNIRGQSVAVLAYCMFGNKYLGHVELAGKDKPGVNPLIMDTVIADITRAKKMYDYVVVMPHWGIEYHYMPMQECVEMAYKMIDVGADAVIGGHTHKVQPIVRYKSKYICFSMGNFLFPDYYMKPPRPIWYPDSSTDLTVIRDVDDYPESIDAPVRRVWQETSRIGYMLDFEINDKTERLKTKYVRLSADNIVQMHNPDKKIKQRLAVAKAIVGNRWLRKMYWRYVTSQARRH